MISEELREVIGCGDCTEHKCDGVYCLRILVGRLREELAAAPEKYARAFAEWEEMERNFGESSPETLIRWLAARNG